VANSKFTFNSSIKQKYLHEIKFISAFTVLSHSAIFGWAAVKFKGGKCRQQACTGYTSYKFSTCNVQLSNPWSKYSFQESGQDCHNSQLSRISRIWIFSALRPYNKNIDISCWMPMPILNLVLTLDCTANKKINLNLNWGSRKSEVRNLKSSWRPWTQPESSEIQIWIWTNWVTETEPQPFVRHLIFCKQLSKPEPESDAKSKLSDKIGSPMRKRYAMLLPHNRKHRLAQFDK